MNIEQGTTNIELKNLVNISTMKINPGDCFRSAPSMTDPNFIDSSIIIATSNNDGCIGFVYNKMFQQPLNALEEFKNIRNFPLYEGGPVDREHLFFIHKRNDLIPGGQQIINALYLAGDFAKAVELINSKIIDEADIKIFIGYCGWDAGELEAEIKEGSWMKRSPAEMDIF